MNLRIEREMIAFESISATKPDEKWKHTDRSGHEHRWDDGYPTLVEVAEPPYWCAGCRDEHQDTHLECKECREIVEPSVLLDPGPHYIPGPASYYHDDERITEEEFKRLMSEITR